MQRRLVIHFQRFGPYHKARLESARESLLGISWEAIGLELASTDSVYQWTSESHRHQSSIHTLFPGRSADQLSQKDIRRAVDEFLDRLNPDAVAIAGWATPDALACLAWCRKNHKKSLLMSETREADGRRIWFKEAIKSFRVRQYSGALVGAQSHVTYLRNLMFRGPVALGYNVVDNLYFHEMSRQWRDHDCGNHVQPNPFILASNRFVKRKNLTRLVQAFASVARLHKVYSGRTVDLCLLGDGPETSTLLVTCKSLGLSVVKAAPWDGHCHTDAIATSPRVFLPGFRQIDELPRFYAHACCFVHPAISEPWGLVINEAMACGLPVLCSLNCGSSEELVINGLNGFIFDPLDIESVSAALMTFLRLSLEQQITMGEASFHLINQCCPTSAFGQGLASLLTDLSVL